MRLRVKKVRDGQVSDWSWEEIELTPEEAVEFEDDGTDIWRMLDAWVEEGYSVVEIEGLDDGGQN